MQPRMSGMQPVATQCASFHNNFIGKQNDGQGQGRMGQGISMKVQYS